MQLSSYPGRSMFIISSSTYVQLSFLDALVSYKGEDLVVREGGIENVPVERRSKVFV